MKNKIHQKILFITTTLTLILSGTMLMAQQIPEQFNNPPREFSVMPFWFWNDTLKADEIIRQIKDFEKHGVYGFVIHPRMGLPIGMDFLDTEMLRLMKVAIEEAERRHMKVILYDEGSYPSGSCQGQVVARNPDHAARGLARIVLEPGKKALEGAHSTMAKNASSAMVHLNRRRNSNELYGAYGHNLTYDEMVWLANWCFIRGQNLLYPHAFYYSVRGARYDERPPDVGPNASWWGNYKGYADACRRLSWLNTDSKQVCEVAILGNANWLPDQSAKVCFQNQRDFNYLELQHLYNDARIDADGIHLGGMNYKAVILDGITTLPEEALPVLKEMAKNKQLIIWKESPFATEFPQAIVANNPEKLIAEIDKLIAPDLNLNPASNNIRYRHVIKDNLHYYLLFNEENSPVSTSLDISVKGKSWWLDEYTAEANTADLEEPVTFIPHELRILMVINE